MKALHTADQEQTHGLPQVQAMIDSICQQEGSVQVMDLSCLAAIEIHSKATRLQRQQIVSEDVGSVSIVCRRLILWPRLPGMWSIGKCIHAFPGQQDIFDSLRGGSSQAEARV